MDWEMFSEGLSDIAGIPEARRIRARDILLQNLDIEMKTNQVKKAALEIRDYMTPVQRQTFEFNDFKNREAEEDRIGDDNAQRDATIHRGQQTFDKGYPDEQSYMEGEGLKRTLENASTRAQAASSGASAGSSAANAEQTGMENDYMRKHGERMPTTGSDDDNRSQEIRIIAGQILGGTMNPDEQTIAEAYRIAEERYNALHGIPVSAQRDPFGANTPSPLGIDFPGPRR